MKPGPRRPLVSLSSAEVHAEILGGGGFFLGRYSEEAIRRELEEAGILSALAERGYPEVQIFVRFDGGQHGLRLVPPRGRISLLDLRLTETTLSLADPVPLRQGLEVLSVLTVHWLSLQNPRARFTAAKPRLPGQVYPGLGLGRRVFERLYLWAQTWGKDGLVNLPEYFHNAVFYSAMFHFLSPDRQGRFEALRRDLGRLHVAVASAAVAEGRVIDLRSGEPFAWEPAEMIAPLGEPLKHYLCSADYSQAVRKAREANRFAVRES